MTELAPSAIDDLLATVAEPDRAIIADAYALAQRLVPEAAVGRSYGMPAMLLHGKGLLSVMPTKTHIGVYPFSSAVVGRFADRFAADMVSRGAMRFPLGIPIPADLLGEVVAARVAELDGARDPERTDAHGASSRSNRYSSRSTATASAVKASKAAVASVMRLLSASSMSAAVAAYAGRWCAGRTTPAGGATSP